ncbi:MAG TPA: ABC transporter permease [Acidimicrobiales bacterium]|nr:ABC transporter permease [Acidimicrobiales bacterium]
MTVAAADRRGSVRDAYLVGRQVRYEQLAFWRNPFGAIFTVGFSVVFLLLLAAGGGNSRVAYLGNIRLIQYYVPGFAAYGVMSACFNMLGIQLVIRRETGLLKRLRLSPLPTWALLSGIFVNAAIISATQVVVLFVIGRFAFDVHLPHNYAALVLALVVGVLCFTALGVAISTVIPNQEAAGPIISIVYFVLLFLSGLWFPLNPGSSLAQISAYFPVRHLILAVFAPFQLQRGESPWAWHDLLVMAIWGVAACVVAFRRFRWEPRRN